MSDPGSRRRLVVLACVAAVVAVVAVALTVARPSGGNHSGIPGPSPTPTGGGLAARARQVMDAYAAALASATVPLVVTDDQLLRQEGDWEPAVADNHKLASATGHLVAATSLPATASTSEAVLADGRRVPAPVMSAREALDALTAARSDCGGCTDLRVTTATLATATVPTGGGTATVPAWRFGLEGTSVTLLRVAVPASALVTPPTTAPVPQAGSRPDGYELAVDGRTLTVHFSGAPDQPGPCGADYRGEAFAGPDAVVVAVLELPRERPSDVACAAIAALRTVQVTLDSPLAARAVLSLVDGLPVVPGDPYAPR